MGTVIRPDPVGGIDILVGVSLLFTQSFLPEGIALLHAAVLIYKGAGTVLEFLPLGGAPLLIVYGAADMLSAAIIATGSPPVMAGLKEFFALALFLKGVFSMLALMG